MSKSDLPSDSQLERLARMAIDLIAASVEFDPAMRDWANTARGWANTPADLRRVIVGAFAELYSGADDSVQAIHDRWVHALRRAGWEHGMDYDYAGRRHPDIVRLEDATPVGGMRPRVIRAVFLAMQWG